MLKDLVEHIRTVHFTVLVIALAMTAAMQIRPNRYAYEVAAADARAVQLINSNWEILNKAIDSYVDVALKNALAQSPEQAFLAKGGGNYAVEFTDQTTGRPFKAEFFVKWNWVHVWGKDNVYLAMETFPIATTLNEFRGIWDEQQNTINGFYAVILEQGFDKESCGTWELRSVGKQNVEKGYAQIQLEFSTDLSKDGVLSIRPILKYDALRHCTFASVKGVKADVDIAPEARNWVRGRSDQAFPQLIAEATNEHIEDTPLVKFAQIIEARADVEPEKIQLFGAEIYLSAIPIIGGILLILSECYLLAHLSELLRLVKNSESSEWAIGYIGLYPNSITFVFTVISLTAFPISPFLVVQNGQLSNFNSSSMVLGSCALILGVLCVSHLAAIRKVLASLPAFQPHPTQPQIDPVHHNNRQKKLPR